uniref:Uncharacterized protein n=1 Tax=Entomoneis paludosa TaxID=265537 RepID=A0A7S3DNC1_9STRA|mmetsp:Transcript_2310/g.4832  ORF Transcript_2310/g.4832 Transcript_2310/m.4832 type:complete len:184 (+) Transcript_2310:257-808(+)|eukprot:CAMPEP_0172444024 /NCGR_PEP_ID=MMETSP1065-20121228/4170_1 /TAXON_ID=265537 /ORGANISM="Amphiprora paludosa, Strain CCMP125" /LENGTH=183 /DNA_ID=CAMNT_0013194441 /DNA_START=160 /DNA_END=711 /DNA_ORIENTATION=-
MSKSALTLLLLSQAWASHAFQAPTFASRRSVLAATIETMAEPVGSTPADQERLEQTRNNLAASRPDGLPEDLVQASSSSEAPVQAEPSGMNDFAQKRLDQIRANIAASKASAPSTPISAPAPATIVAAEPTPVVETVEEAAPTPKSAPPVVGYKSLETFRFGPSDWQLDPTPLSVELNAQFTP